MEHATSLLKPSSELTLPEIIKINFALIHVQVLKSQKQPIATWQKWEYLAFTMSDKLQTVNLLANYMVWGTDIFLR